MFSAVCLIIGYAAMFYIGFELRDIMKKRSNINFEIVRSVSGKWFYRIVSRNGNILAHSEEYKSKQSVLKTIRAVKSGAAAAVTKEKL